MRLAAIVAVVMATCPFRAGAQEPVRTLVDENLRLEPQGQILGRLDAGAPLTRRSARDSWVEVTVEGWVWTASLRTTERNGFDLVVSVTDGENLRAEPSGEVLGRLEEGTLLEEVGRETGWVRVRRTAWMWSESVSEPAEVTADEARSESDAASRSASGAAPSGAGEPDRFLRVQPGTEILGAPDGDTLAVTSGNGDVEVLAREGNWARVRLDGWMWRPRSADESDEEGAPPAEEVTPETLAEPTGESYRGRRVRWTVQFISLERAEAIRTDFFEGEPFILGRFGGGDGPFVYVAVPPDRVPEVQGLTPLDLVTVTGRVRETSSTLTGTPILDLLSIERGSER
ncbi:MAG: hypothetical protein U5R14_04720 [Gemmatimonadota bacterium]|nr:hypothetical protein [Gemmatimonadota bacterium]